MSVAAAAATQAYRPDQAADIPRDAAMRSARPATAVTYRAEQLSFRLLVSVETGFGDAATLLG